MYDLIIKNGTLVTPEKTLAGSIAVKDGRIAALGGLPSAEAADIYDAEGMHILPGLIDAHVHFRDPGLTEKEDFRTGSIAAAFGGIASIADMPNVLPPSSTALRIKDKVRIAQEKSYTDFAFFALLTNENTNEMEELKKAGAIGFKIFLGTSTGDIAAPSPGVLFEQMEKSVSLGMRIGFHAETSDLNQYFTSLCMKKTGMPQGMLLADSRPVLSEVLAIQTAVTYAEYTGAKIHIHHVTSLDGARLIEDAKNKGIDVTAETCPHYLFLDADMENAHKVYPPIRAGTHRKGLWDALSRGVIDMAASDHAPHLAEEKALPLHKAPAGLCGVETLAPLFLNAVNQGRLSLNDFARLASEAPAKIWNIYPKKGSLEPGADADFTIVDMSAKKTISIKDLHSKSRTSPYHGMEVQGLPVSTVIRGKFAVKDGELLDGAPKGVFINPLNIC